MNKKIKMLSAITLITVLALIGCSKKEDNLISQNNQHISQIENIQKESNENIIDILSTNIVYANDIEFIKGTKKITSQFSRWLNKYNIENKIALDGYSVQNTNTDFEENNINYKRQVYLDTIDNNEYKVNLVYENHIQEPYSKDNEFIKLVYDVVKTYNEGLSIDDFTHELNSYVNKEIETLSFDNQVVRINISNKNTTKHLSMAFEREIEDIIQESPKKEYATIKDFINDSNEFANKIKEKSDKLSALGESAFNIGGKDAINWDLKNEIYMMANLDGELYQQINVDIDIGSYNESGVSLKDEALELVYSVLEDVYGDELKQYYTLEDFKNIAKSNTKSKLSSMDSPDEITNTTLHMPYLVEGELGISNTLDSKEFAKDDLYYSVDSDQKIAILETFDSVVLSNGWLRLEIKIPVVAEGISYYQPAYSDGNYVLDDGTVVKPIDTRNR